LHSVGGIVDDDEKVKDRSWSWGDGAHLGERSACVVCDWSKRTLWKKYCVSVAENRVTDGRAWTGGVSKWEGTLLLAETITVMSVRKVQPQLAALNFPSGRTHCSTTAFSSLNKTLQNTFSDIRLWGSF